MTFAPETLTRLATYWKEQGGVNLGIVGDAAHTARPSYHNGQDVIRRNGWTAATDYSIRLPRDREPHLTDAASAIDLGRLDDKLVELYRFSRWLVAQCQASAAGANDVREIIYSPDGVHVQRYSGVDGQIHTGPGNGDASHRFHTHISFHRDSQGREKVGLFSPYFSAATGEVGAMLGYTLDPARRRSGRVRITRDGAMAVRLDDGALIPVLKGEVKDHGGFGKLAKDLGTGAGTPDPSDDDRRSGWYLWGARPAWILGYAAEELDEPDPDVKHIVALAIDGTIDPSTSTEV